MSEVTSLLSLALTAKRDGDLEVARQFLLNVIALDDTNETAWLYLSEILSEPYDALICLENASTLNPNNLFVQLKLASARRQLGPAHNNRPSSIPRIARDPFFEEELEADSQPVPTIGQYLMDVFGLRRVDLAQAMMVQSKLTGEGSLRPLGQVLIDLGFATGAQVDYALRHLRLVIDRPLVG